MEAGTPPPATLQPPQIQMRRLYCFILKSILALVMYSSNICNIKDLSEFTLVSLVILFNLSVRTSEIAERPLRQRGTETS